MSAATGEESADRNVEMWKIKRLIKSLEMARGYAYTQHTVWLLYDTISLILRSFRNGTSMISLIIPPREQIAKVSKMLADEFGTASNIKSRVNRLSVLGAITSVQARLKLYNRGRGGQEHRLLTISHCVCLFSTDQWTGDLLWNDRD